jgi:hypothetical protein
MRRRIASCFRHFAFRGRPARPVVRLFGCLPVRHTSPHTARSGLAVPTGLICLLWRRMYSYLLGWGIADHPSDKSAIRKYSSAIPHSRFHACPEHCGAEPFRSEYSLGTAVCDAGVPLLAAGAWTQVALCRLAHGIGEQTCASHFLFSCGECRPVCNAAGK